MNAPIEVMDKRWHWYVCRALPLLLLIMGYLFLSPGSIQAERLERGEFAIEIATPDGYIDVSDRLLPAKAAKNPKTLYLKAYVNATERQQYATIAVEEEASYWNLTRDAFADVLASFRAGIEKVLQAQQCTIVETGSDATSLFYIVKKPVGTKTLVSRITFLYLCNTVINVHTNAVAPTGTPEEPQIRAVNAMHETIAAMLRRLNPESGEAQ